MALEVYHPPPTRVYVALRSFAGHVHVELHRVASEARRAAVAWREEQAAQARRAERPQRFAGLAEPLWWTSSDSEPGEGLFGSDSDA